MAIINCKPDIVSVISRYINLRKTGKSYIGLCPFHHEKTPSFIVSPNRQCFKCFGCGTGGDVIYFIQKMLNKDFRGAISYLGISSAQKYKPDSTKQKRRVLLEEFRQWERDYFDEVSTFYRTLNKLKLQAKTQEDVDRLADAYKQKSIWEYHLDILTFGDDEQKFELYKEKRKNENRHGTKI